MVAAAILNFEKCLYLSIGWKYYHQIWWTDVLRPYGDYRRYSDNVINNYKMAFSLHVLDRLSDEYS